MAVRVTPVLLRANSLWALALTALFNRDVEAVRSLASQALAAAEAVGYASYSASAKAYLTWLAWQDGRREDVGEV